MTRCALAKGPAAAALAIAAMAGFAILTDRSRRCCVLLLVIVSRGGRRLHDDGVAGEALLRGLGRSVQGLAILPLRRIDLTRLG